MLEEKESVEDDSELKTSELALLIANILNEQGLTSDEKNEKIYIAVSSYLPF